MSEKNENLTNPQGSELSELNEMFNDYQNNQKKKKRKSSEEILAKYFVPRKNIETFRILPKKAGKKPIEEAFFHVVSTTTSGGKKKHGTVIYCPAHNNPKVPKMENGQPVLDQNGQQVLIPESCPLCAKHKKLLSKQDPSLKGIKKENMTDAQKKINDKNKEIFTEANKFEAKKFYIVRGIDKGAEKDGVKFWRFKYNFKNQGTYDKLIPILNDFVEQNGISYSDVQNGTDLKIIMTDTEFNGHVYKTISAITNRGKSPLHADPIVVKQWLDDNISWREVFQPKKAPGITPYQFLELVAEGNSPYWDDSDANNKHWVFPNHPDLEAAANTRTRNLDGDAEEEFEQASDLDVEYVTTSTTISNVTASKVGTYKDDSVNVGAEVIKQNEPVDEIPDTIEPEGDGNAYDDLPF